MTKAYIFTHKVTEADIERFRLFFDEIHLNQAIIFNEQEFMKIRENFDIIILYDLPSDSALPLLRRLKDKLSVPVFYFSYVKEPDTILEAFKFGVEDFFVPPFNIREFSEKLNKVIPGATFKRSIAELAKKYIEINYNLPIKLTDIAKSVGCTPEHLARVFKAKYNITPHSYLKKIRLEKVKKYLITTNLPLSEIYKATGFYSAPHLCREFKKQENITPFNYRQKYSKLM